MQLKLFSNDEIAPTVPKVRKTKKPMARGTLRVIKVMQKSNGLFLILCQDSNDRIFWKASKEAPVLAKASIILPSNKEFILASLSKRAASY